MTVNKKFVRHGIGAVLTIAALIYIGARSYIELAVFAALLGLSYQLVGAWIVSKVAPRATWLSPPHAKFVTTIAVLLASIYLVLKVLWWCFGITGIGVSAAALVVSCCLWPAFVLGCDHFGLLQDATPAKSAN